MSVFTASNGIKIERTDAVLVFPGAKIMTVQLGAPQIDANVTVALREFFRHEEDERLGRWRWPENTDYVVYAARDGDGVHWSVNERTGESHMNTRPGLQSDEHARAARAYFAAHPEPKPWDAAEEGDIWVLTGAGGLEQPWRRVGHAWISCTVNPRAYTAELATAGRRIWPEATS